MSWNIHAEVKNIETEELIPITLVRANRGITSTALVAVNDVITFDGIEARVMRVVHEHAAPQSPHAPNSHVYVRFLDEIGADEQDTLLRHGFMADVPGDN